MARWFGLLIFLALMSACGGQEDPTFTPTPIQDRDQDGFTRSEDCDDTDPHTYPDAPESCDELDNDCDGRVDEGSRRSFYQDQDGDGYGAELLQACEPIPGFVAQGGDCNDRDVSVNPGVIEACDSQGGTASSVDGIDNDCDGAIDEDLSALYYFDGDGDGYGGEDGPTEETCEPSLGYVQNGEDCDDSNADINPGAQEVCTSDPTDEDCDGLIDSRDPDIDELTTYYQDQDGDGFGNGNIPINACSQPQGYVSSDDDCDDKKASVYPGAEEICDGLDNDCDSLIDGDDDSLNGALTAYPDDDGDGYGESATATSACAIPTGYVSVDGDCDDSRGDVYPGAPERCDSAPTGLGVDNDCDGQADEAGAVNAQTYYVDADGDGVGDGTASLESCNPEVGTVAFPGDCDDSDPASAPNLPERPGTGIDEDCDGAIDEGDGDSDGDGYPALGGSGEEGDCDDSDAEVSPGAWEVFGDGIDNDCDGKTDADIYVLRSGSPPESGKPVFATIQGALGASRSGQLIAVGAGSYLENVNFLGKDVTLYAIEGPEPTVIDGGRGGSAVKMVSGEGPGARLVGFSLVGGDGADCPAAVPSGGGICVVDGSPSIRGNIIALNEASRGGGIYARGMNGRIEGNLIRLNRASGVGGGVYLERSSPRFVDNDISENSAGLDGGGLYVVQGSPEVRGCRFTQNDAFVGGGVYLDSGRGVVSQCIFKGNVASGWGGGINGVRDGTLMSNVILAGNEAGSGGGGMRLFGGESRLHHLTVVANGADIGGGIFLEGGGVEELAYCILAFNEGGEGANLALGESATAPLTAYNGYYLSDEDGAGIHRGSMGEGDEIEDPLFVNDPTDGLWEQDDYHLLPASPFVDVRIGSSVGNDPDGSPGDLGAYGGPSAIP